MVSRTWPVVAASAVVVGLVGTLIPLSANGASSAAPVAARAGAAVLPPTQIRVIGRSVEGRRIVARQYGPRNATKVGVIVGSMHGSENGGMNITRLLLSQGAPRDTAMWVIQTLNPDGSLRGQRKNARGVDLNRNGPHLWKSWARAPDYYPGPRPLSEPETRAYVSFFNQIRPDLVMVFHQAGNGVDSYRQKNRGLTRGLSARTGAPIKSFSCDGECTGTLTGWFNASKPGTAITIELTRPVTTRQVARWAAASRWAIRYIPDM